DHPGHHDGDGLAAALGPWVFLGSGAQEARIGTCFRQGRRQAALPDRDGRCAEGGPIGPPFVIRWSIANLRSRSRACATLILRICAPGGALCSGAKRRNICRATCCFASWPIGSRAKAWAISTRKRCDCWIALLRETVATAHLRFGSSPAATGSSR